MKWVRIVLLIILALAFPYISIPTIIIIFIVKYFKKRKHSKKEIETPIIRQAKKEIIKTKTSIDELKGVDETESVYYPEEQFVPEPKIEVPIKKDVPQKKWVISVSFGESTSKNFERALYIAKQSNHFSNYTTDEGTLVYQADFDKDNFLNYLDLYKIVSNWKSSFVFINGQRVNKKELSTINRCYGDKISFDEKFFCFGASVFTENPFGCHRLMLTPSQHSWQHYGKRKGNYWIIDKNRITNIIMEQSRHVEGCPSFNLEFSLSVVDKLPDKIKMEQDYFLY